MTALYIAIIAAAAYLLGCANGAIIVSKTVKHKDVRELGSGNAGLTNFYRNFGKGAAIWVILIDVLKAVIAVVFAGFLMEKAGYKMAGQEIALFFVVVGHMYPLFFEFRGGKGILSCAGGLAVIDLRALAILLAVFAVILLISRIVSLSSICAAIAFPVVMLLFHGDAVVALAALATAVLMIVKHGANIKRLVKGEEPRFKFKK